MYVGNLARTATEDDLRQAFGQYGAVSTVNIIKGGREEAAVHDGSGERSSLSLRV